MLRTRLLTLSMAATLLLAAACKEESAPITPEPGSGGSGAGTGSGGKPAGTVCPANAKGAKMVLVTTDKGESYCIDEREVLQSEYATFLDAKGTDVSGQPPECADNDTYTPPEPNNSGLPTANACPKGDWDPNATPNRPMVCVDFCDAAAYCTWAGKRLCSSLDAPSDAVLKLKSEAEIKALMGSTRHEWTHACTQGGKTAYPYGDEYEPAKCIDKPRYDAEGPTALRTGDLSDETCHGTEAPYSDIFHMSGSVAEWVNVCSDSGGSCVYQGGAGVWADLALYPCSQPATAPRLKIAPYIGIRCCADLE